MNVVRLCLALLLFLLLSPVRAHAVGFSDERYPTPFTNLGWNTWHSISGWNTVLHAGGAAATGGLISSGADYRIHNYFQDHNDRYNVYTLPAVYLGYAGPVVLGGGLYLGGYLYGSVETAAAGCAVLQASLIAWSWTSALKVFTGRQNPDNHPYTAENEKSGNFRWGFMENGIHYGWPSGHLGVTTAIASSLAYYYNDSLPVRVSSWLVWTYMVFGVIAHEGNTMHWTSDVVAGSMMGFAIGSTVGRDFRERFRGNGGGAGVGAFSAAGCCFSPVIGDRYFGMSADYAF